MFDTGIYTITSPSGKRYIGSAVSFHTRWIGHRTKLRNRTHHNRPLQSAFNKYGEEALIFRKVLFCEPADLITYEQIFIDYLKPEYNVARTAGSRLGMRMSEDARKKMSESRLGKRRKPCSPETKAKIGAKVRGQKRTPEQRLKISVALKGRFISAETRAKLAATQKGRTLSEERKAKLRASNLGKSMSPEQRKKVSDASTSVRAVKCLEPDLIFRSASDAAKWLMNVPNLRAAAAAICNVCSGRYKTAYGYKWAYADEIARQAAIDEAKAESSAYC